MSQMLHLSARIGLLASADSPDSQDSPEMGSSGAGQTLGSTRAGGQDDGSYTQTPSNHTAMSISYSGQSCKYHPSTMRKMRQKTRKLDVVTGLVEIATLVKKKRTACMYW